MNKTVIILIAVTLTIVIGGVFLFARSESEPVQALPAPTTYEYYWGDGCPHCKNVQDFFDSWENYDKVKIEKYEVWNNKENQKRMQARANACQINLREMGVPMLVIPNGTDTGTCIGGDTPIIDHFKNLKFDEVSPSPSPISLGNPEVSYGGRGVLVF